MENLIKKHFPDSELQPKIFNDLLPEFFIQINKSLSLLLVAQGKSDIKDLFFHCHSMKGALLTFGARKTANICLQMEKIDKTNIVLINEKVLELRKAISDLNEANTA